MADAPGTPEPISAEGKAARRLVHGTAWALGGRAVGAAGAFAFSVYAARHLPPAEFAGFALVLSLGAAAIAIGVVGLDQAIVKTLAARLAASAGASLGRYAAVCIGAASISAVLAAAVIWWPGRNWLLPLVGVPVSTAIAATMVWWVVLGILHRVMVESLRGVHEIRSAAQLAGVGRSGSLWGIGVLTCMFVINAIRGLDLAGAVASLAIANTVLALIAVVLTTRFVFRRTVQGQDDAAVPVPELASEIGAVAAPLAGAAVFRQLRLSADLWLLGALAASAQVAIYGASARAMLIVMLPITVVNAVLPPIIAETYARGDTGLLERVARTAASVSGVIALSLALAIVIGGEAALGLLFGEFYRGAYAVIVLLAMGQLVAVLVGPCAILLSMTGGQAVLIKVMMVATAGIVLLGTPAAMLYGAVGMATASMLVTAGQNLALSLIVRKRLGIRTYASMRPDDIRGFRDFLRLRRGRPDATRAGAP